MSPVPDEKSDARILATLRTHDEREAAILESYRHLVEESTDEGIRYLGQLIVEDEERHHRLIAEMIARIETWVHGEQMSEATPSLTPRVDPHLLAETHTLIALEHEDASELRLLKKELRYAPATSLLPILVELMLADTARHIEILHFIRNYTG
jgi:hypothetical protein